MSFFGRFINANWMLVLPLLLILVLTPPVYFFVGRDAAWILSNLGTLLVVFGVLIYVVYVDSRRRWPTLTTWQRFVRIITFQR